MKQNKCLLVGLISLMFSINSLYAQKDSLNVSTNNESYKRVYILDVGKVFFGMLGHVYCQ